MALLPLQPNDERGQRILRGQWLPASDILQIKSHAVGYPGARLYRSAIAQGGKEFAVRRPDANVNDLCARSAPTERGTPVESGARDRYGVWTGAQGWLERRARRIHRGQTDVVLEYICAGRGQVLDIKAVRRGHLHRRVARQNVSTNDVSLDWRSQKETARIPNGRVVLNDVVVGASALETDAKVVSLGRVTVST